MELGSYKMNMSAYFFSTGNWMACLDFVILLTFVADVTCIKFKKRDVINGEMIDGTQLWSGSASGGIECGSVCADEEECTHFAVNSEANQCILFDMGTTGSNIIKTAEMNVFELCGPNQYRIGGRCIVFDRGPVTWYKARDACVLTGGNLAVIDSQAMHDAVRQIVIQKDSESTFADVWVDGSDEAQEGSWIIWDGRSLPWISWSAGQPDNYLSEQCMGFRRSQSFYMNDGQCQWGSPYICQLNFGT